MSATRTYSVFHKALQDYCAEGSWSGVTPQDFRALLALYERGGEATSDQLQIDLLQFAQQSSQLRRSVSVLRTAGLVVGGDKPGPRRAAIRLTDAGREACEGLHARVEFQRQHQEGLLNESRTEESQT